LRLEGTVFPLLFKEDASYNFLLIYILRKKIKNQYEGTSPAMTTQVVGEVRGRKALLLKAFGEHFSFTPIFLRIYETLSRILTFATVDSKEKKPFPTKYCRKLKFVS
jgi:hypothetical protein